MSPGNSSRPNGAAVRRAAQAARVAGRSFCRWCVLLLHGQAVCDRGRQRPVRHTVLVDAQLMVFRLATMIFAIGGCIAASA
jgi:hypothetical protein